LTRVVRVLPDVTAVDRAFDYTIDEDVPVGTIVRVPLHGRRVRGWIVAADVEPEADTLLPVHAVVSAGPPPDVVDLSAWVAHRWAGPRVAVLRSASAPNVVPATVWAQTRATARATAQTVGEVGERVVRWPPLLDRRDLVAGMCAPEGSTIVCVADAGRARALASYLSRTVRNVALLHSAQPDAARTEAWARGAAGNCVVVGGRIAAVAPVPDLRAAVVVDDADEALQEERAPTWHARDVLRERAARAGAPFIVCSPAPTVEAVFAAGDDVDVASRDVERGGWPRVQVVDRREEPPGAGLLSDALADALHHTPGLAVCILNRRGRFRLLVCTACHELLRWDAAAERPSVCPECGAPKLRVLRAGVSRVRDELAALMPGKRVVDVDAATTEVPAADIVIGTEAALHRAAIRRQRPALIAYLDLDQELLAPRYRAATQAHWLVTRGAQLLASRPRAETLLLLQTRLPDHAVVQAIARADPQLVVDAELDYRRALAYPPFGALAELSGDEEPLTVAIDELRALDVQATGVQVFGPENGHALVTAPTWDDLGDALARALPAGRALGRLRAAVDPPRI
jgi:primosomal protein N' (replication factor Y) (superfamily II helicase)